MTSRLFAILAFLLIFDSIAADQFCPLWPTRLFEQSIDHRGRNNGTFAQRYQLVTDFYRPGGPILLYQGAESGVFSCIEYLSLTQYANETDALLLNINHRYFNDSVPFGPINSTIYDWQYLTLENVMMDSVKLVEYVKQNVSGVVQAKTFVAGGSYGGFLATMLRVNHPETFDGAIASGSPGYVDGADYPNTMSQYIQPDWISNVYEDFSNPVANAINQSWTMMDRMLGAGNASGLQQELNLCSAPRNATELSQLQSQLESGVQSASQFNYPLAAATSTNVSYPLQYIVSSSGSDPSPLTPLKAYTSIGWAAVNPERPECYDWAAASQDLGHSISTIPYTYIICTYFPLLVSASRKGNIFRTTPAAELTHAMITERCASYGSPHMNTPAEMRALGLSQERLAETTNIIFTLGQYDPITGYGVQDFKLSADRGAPRRLYVSEMAHTQDLMAYNSFDSATVLDVRNTTVQYIKAWRSSPEYRPRAFQIRQQCAEDERRVHLPVEAPAYYCLRRSEILS